MFEYFLLLLQLYYYNFFKTRRWFKWHAPVAYIAIYFGGARNSTKINCLIVYVIKSLLIFGSISCEHISVVSKSSLNFVRLLCHCSNSVRNNDLKNCNVARWAKIFRLLLKNLPDYLISSCFTYVHHWLTSKKSNWMFRTKTCKIESSQPTRSS